MPNYEIQIQVTIRETAQAVTPEAHQAAEGSFRTVVSGASGQRIEECERALLAVNYPALREAFSRHLSEVSQQEAARDGVGRVKKMPPLNSTVNCRRSALGRRCSGTATSGAAASEPEVLGAWLPVHQYAPVFINSQLFGFDYLPGQVGQVLVVEIEPTLECPVGQTAFPFQQLQHLGQHVIERHVCTSSMRGLSEETALLRPYSFRWRDSRRTTSQAAIFC